MRDKYAQQYAALYQLYQDASSLRYLTSLIAVPKLDPVSLAKTFPFPLERNPKPFIQNPSSASGPSPAVRPE